MQIERIIEETSLPHLKKKVNAFIDEKLQEGFQLSRVNMVREKDKRIACIYMEDAQ